MAFSELEKALNHQDYEYVKNWCENSTYSKACCDNWDYPKEFITTLIYQLAIGFCGTSCIQATDEFLDFVDGCMDDDLDNFDQVLELFIEMGITSYEEASADKEILIGFRNSFDFTALKMKRRNK